MPGMATMITDPAAQARDLVRLSVMVAIVYPR